MTLNRAALKANAKIDIRKTRPNAVLVTLVFSLIVLVLEILSARINGNWYIISEMLYAFYEGDYMFEMPQVWISPVAWLILLAITLMTTMLSAGYQLFALRAVRHASPSYGNLFDPFGMFFRILWLNILTGIFIWLWSMLFIIPGIVAAYRYRLAMYIRFEHPEFSALDCIRYSKQLMQGHKGELFVLDLSFLGWLFLCIVPFVSLWVNPYMEFTNAWFYISLADGPAVGGPHVNYGGPGDAPGRGSGERSDGKPPWEM